MKKSKEKITVAEAIEAEEIAVPREEIVAEIGEEAVAKIEEEAVEVEVVEEVPVVAKKSSKSGSVSVYHKLNFIREYSSEIHGKDYLNLAEMFAEKIGGVVK